MHPLATLICGDNDKDGSPGEVTLHLASVLDRLLVRAKILRDTGDAVDLALIGPFLGRAAIEVGMTATLARFDPFRVLAIRQSQLSADYDTKVRNPLAFSWQSDVQGEEKPKEWSDRPAIKDLQRALLCRHFHDVFWLEAFTSMLDKIPYGKGGTWMEKLRLINPEGVTKAMRTKAERLYSELSKGIHYEFVIPMTAQYDQVTVANLLAGSWELIASLGVAACYSPAIKMAQSLKPVDLFEEAQEELLAK